MENICRICMKVSNDLIHINANQDASEENLMQMFEECLNLKLNTFPNYQKICLRCKIQLVYYYEFKQQALDTHEQLVKLETVCDSDKSNTQEDILSNVDVEDEQYLGIEYLDEELEGLQHFQNCEQIKNEIDDVKEDYLEEFEIISNSIPIDYVERIDDEYEIEFKHDPDEVEEEITYEPEEWELRENSGNEFIETEIDTKGKLKSRRWKFRCAQCKKNFRTEKTYQAHVNVHNGLPPYQCSLCNKTFKYRVNHEYHMKNHNGDREYKCSICNKCFLCKWDLKLHMRVHANIRPFICEICGKGFRVRSHMTDHKETHNENNTYECPVCKQKYKTKVTLKLHYNSIHLKTRQYTCPVCSRTFNRKHHLKVHSKTHEKNIIQDQT